MSKILIIDDEEMIRSIAERILKRAGYDVLVAVNGIEGLAEYTSNSDQIDLVICDICMDDLSGFEVLEEIRKISPQIPGVISSGNPYNLEEIPEAIKEDIYFLQKPYRANQLTELIQSILVSQS